MGAHGADKLLRDVQTYHDIHHKIVTQKMHQITPPRNGGSYGDKPCENPQCSECPKARHMAVGYSSSSQEATVLRHSRQIDRQTEQQLPNISSSPAADSSPPRQIAAAMPPKIVTAPSNLFDNNKPGDNIFISPPVARAKWDPIKNGNLPAMPQDDVDFTHMIPFGLNKLLKRQGEQNERRMHNILSKSAKKQKLRRPYVSLPMGHPSTSAD
jgi:hypothetical protein